MSRVRQLVYLVSTQLGWGNLSLITSTLSRLCLARCLQEEEEGEEWMDKLEGELLELPLIYPSKFSHPAAQPFRRSAVQPFRRSAVLPFRRSAVPPHRQGEHVLHTPTADTCLVGLMPGSVVVKS